jgi:hypothetical protein
MTCNNAKLLFFGGKGGMGGDFGSLYDSTAQVCVTALLHTAVLC